MFLRIDAKRLCSGDLATRTLGLVGVIADNAGGPEGHADRTSLDDAMIPIHGGENLFPMLCRRRAHINSSCVLIAVCSVRNTLVHAAEDNPPPRAETVVAAVNGSEPCRQASDFVDRRTSGGCRSGVFEVFLGDRPIRLAMALHDVRFSLGFVAHGISPKKVLLLQLSSARPSKLPTQTALFLILRPI
jgi:hypothetical protein